MSRKACSISRCCGLCSNACLVLAPWSTSGSAKPFADLFEQQFTAETVRRYKPARETYQMVAQATGTQLSELCMIAAHPWDLIGACTAGCSAALIARADVAPLIVPGPKQPQIIASSLTEIAAQLVELKHV